MSTFSPSISSAERNFLSNLPPSGWGVIHPKSSPQSIISSPLHTLKEAQILNGELSISLYLAIDDYDLSKSKVFKLKTMNESGYAVVIPRDIIKKALSPQTSKVPENDQQITPSDATITIAERESLPLDFEDHPLTLLDEWRINDPNYVAGSFAKQLERAKMFHGPKAYDVSEWEKKNGNAARIQINGGDLNSYGFGYATSVGGSKRRFNEDLAYKDSLELNLEDECITVPFFGILDGHSQRDGAGSHHTKYIAEHFSKQFKDLFHLEYNRLNPEQKKSPEWIDVAIFNAFKLSYVNISNGSFNENLSHGSAGSTATISMIFREHLYTACTGDSRAIYIDGKTIIPLSWDAKVFNQDTDPALSDKFNRTLCNRGTGVYIDEGKKYRALSGLNITHALGHDTNHGVNSRPKITKIPLTEKPSFVLAASDGLWDVVSSMLAGKTLWTLANIGTSYEKIARELVLNAIHAGTKDNVTAFILELSKKKQQTGANINVNALIQELSKKKPKDDNTTDIIST